MMYVSSRAHEKSTFLLYLPGVAPDLESVQKVLSAPQCHTGLLSRPVLERPVVRGKDGEEELRRRKRVGDQQKEAKKVPKN